MEGFGFAAGGPDESILLTKCLALLHCTALSVKASTLRLALCHYAYTPVSVAKSD